MRLLLSSIEGHSLVFFDVLQSTSRGALDAVLQREREETLPHQQYPKLHILSTGPIDMSLACMQNNNSPVKNGRGKEYALPLGMLKELISFLIALEFKCQVHGFKVLGGRPYLVLSSEYSPEHSLNRIE